jgi:predicted metalloprotease with PDZ domain
VRHRVRISDPEHHRVEGRERRFHRRHCGHGVLPVWTPGSYLIREYSRHVETIAATAPDGAALALEKTAKNRWRVAGAGAGFALRYRLYCHELTVRTTVVDGDFAILQGAATFVAGVGDGERSHQVR